MLDNKDIDNQNSESKNANDFTSAAKQAIDNEVIESVSGSFSESSSSSSSSSSSDTESVTPISKVPETKIQKKPLVY